MDALERLLEEARGDREVAAVVLFGSAARGEPRRDVDVALFRHPRASVGASDLRMRYMDHFDRGVDVHVFQSLPLYIRHRVLKEGKILLANDEDAMYEAAFDAIREWERFRPFYREYLEGVGRA